MAVKIIAGSGPLISVFQMGAAAKKSLLFFFGGDAGCQVDTHSGTLEGIRHLTGEKNTILTHSPLWAIRTTNHILRYPLSFEIRLTHTHPMQGAFIGICPLSSPLV